MLDQTDLRQTFLQKRSELPADSQSEAALKILMYLRSLWTPKNWLMYSPIKSEVPIEPIFKWAKAKADRVYFPKIKKNEMEFYEVDTLSELKPGRWSLEPSSDRPADFGIPTISLVPGVVFNFRMHRIGMGMGFYDRFFLRHPQVLRVGLAYDFQMSDLIWHEQAHDQAMDVVLTPSGVWGSFHRLVSLSLST